ncbi:unnamed protein product [Effrenium voratum]|nr:unnamed protein product [Effrenium voratum]
MNAPNLARSASDCCGLTCWVWQPVTRDSSATCIPAPVPRLQLRVMSGRVYSEPAVRRTAIFGKLAICPKNRQPESASLLAHTIACLEALTSPRALFRQFGYGCCPKCVILTQSRGF